jgi:hypothetical protein
MNGKELAEAVADFINGAGKKECQAFVDTIIFNTHRTLQQAIMRSLVVPLIIKWGTSESYDLRNEATIRLSRELKGTVESYHLPYI